MSDEITERSPLLHAVSHAEEAPEPLTTLKTLIRNIDVYPSQFTVSFLRHLVPTAASDPRSSLVHNVASQLTLLLYICTPPGRNALQDALHDQGLHDAYQLQSSPPPSVIHEVFEGFVKDYTESTSLSVVVNSDVEQGHANGRVVRKGVDIGIEELLWREIRIEEKKPIFMRVADLMYITAEGEVLLRTPLIAWHIERVWTRGLSPPETTSISKRVIYFIQSLATPRVSHALDVLVHLISIGVLAHLLLYPSYPPTNQFGWRDVALVVYAITSGLTIHRSLAVRMGQIPIIGAYALSYPYSPSPDTTSQYLLLLSFLWSSLLLLSPELPTPVFLLPSDTALSVSVEFASMLQPSIVRPMLFFLPLILIALFLVSLSLESPWSAVMYVYSAAFVDPPRSPPPKSPRAPVPTPIPPYSTRVAFTALFSLTVLLALLYGSMSMIRHAARGEASSESPLVVEAEHAREKGAVTRALLGATLTYGRVRRPPFPPPLNVVPFALVTLPRVFMCIVTLNFWGRENTAWLDGWERFVWWILVLPEEILLAGIWGWRRGGY